MPPQLFNSWTNSKGSKSEAKKINAYLLLTHYGNYTEGNNIIVENYTGNYSGNCSEK